MSDKLVILVSIISAVLVLALSWGLVLVNRAVFRRLRNKHGGLYVFFFEKVISAAIIIAGIILAFSIFGGFDSVWKTLLGGTAVITAVLVFAAQDTIKDILAGLMISIYKPFEIGNRIELEDKTTGIVTDITLRHVVLKGMDTQMLVIPNSRLNVMNLRNYSYQMTMRSARFDFYIAYGSDVEKAMEVIRNAVMASEYTVPGKPSETGLQYAPVYFMAYEASSLKFSTTAYYNSMSPTEAVISDVNLKVGKALKENGIEIPYPYINIISHGPAAASVDHTGSDF